jgi:hypothetical protein
VRSSEPRILASQVADPTNHIRDGLSGDFFSGLLERTFQIIDGRLEVAAHGKRDMPVWGEVYKPAWDFGVITSPQYAKDLAESIARIRILALVEFISTLQTK